MPAPNLSHNPLRLLLIVCSFLLASGTAKAQLIVNSNTGATALIQALVGGGLTVSNVTLSCDTDGYGTFSNGASTTLGINNGIILTTGSCDSVPGSGSTSGFDNSNCHNFASEPPDADLVSIDPNATFDPCILEFDIIPSCNQLTIRFVFGSEEYPTFVGSTFNDVFGFFITGPNPAGGNYTSQNIATLPNGTPVSINNVNNGSSNTGPCQNCAYYINNQSSTTIDFNGLTTVLTVNLALVPCQSYHFKIAIADAGDCALDSGVFIDYLSCSTALSSAITSVPATCGNCDGTATVTPSGGTPPYTYTWLPTGGNAATAINLCPGTYSVIIQDNTGCGPSDTATVTVASSNGLSVTTVQSNPVCFGDCNGSATVMPTGGSPPFTYTWSPSGGNGSSATGLCAGNYTCTISDNSSCNTTQTFSITQPPPLAMSFVNDTICGGGSATISVNPSGGTGPYTVTWSNSLPNGTSQTVSPAATTTYTATATDANGCTFTQTLTVVVAPAPAAQFTATPGGCAPYSANFTNTSTGGATYLWDFGDPGSGLQNVSTQQTPTHLYNSNGTYNVTLIVTNAGGCSDTLQMVGAVVVSAQPVANLTPNNSTVSELSPDVTFTDASSGGSNCITYFGDGDSIVGCNQGIFSHTYPAAGIYNVTQIITNADGCSDTITFSIYVELETAIYVPNAFTPFNGGPNDMFYAYGSNVKTFLMYVFDRWGNLIFQTDDLNYGWDGTYKGNKCQEDVYVWRIVYTDSRDKKHKLIGHITLLR